MKTGWKDGVGMEEKRVMGVVGSSGKEENEREGSKAESREIQRKEDSLEGVRVCRKQ